MEPPKKFSQEDDLNVRRARPSYLQPEQGRRWKCWTAFGRAREVIRSPIARSRSSRFLLRSLWGRLEPSQVFWKFGDCPEESPGWRLDDRTGEAESPGWISTAVRMIAMYRCEKVCYHCRKPGHFRHDCRQLKQLMHQEKKSDHPPKDGKKGAPTNIV